MKEYQKYLIEALDIDEEREKQGLVNVYNTDDAFDIHDTSKLYEIVKIFNDFFDKQPYFQTITHSVDSNDKSLKFTIVTDNNHVLTNQMLEGAIEAIKAEIERLFGKTFTIESSVKEIFGNIGDMGLGSSQGKNELTIFIKQKLKDK